MDNPLHLCSLTLAFNIKYYVARLILIKLMHPNFLFATVTFCLKLLWNNMYCEKHCKYNLFENERYLTPHSAVGPFC